MVVVFFRKALAESTYSNLDRVATEDRRHSVTLGMIP